MKKNDFRPHYIINFMNDIMQIIKAYFIICGGYLVLATSEGWGLNSVTEVLYDSKKIFELTFLLYMTIRMITAIIYGLPQQPLMHYIVSGITAACSFFVIVHMVGKIDVNLLFSFIIIIYFGRTIGFIWLNSKTTKAETIIK